MSFDQKHSYTNSIISTEETDFIPKLDFSVPPPFLFDYPGQYLHHNQDLMAKSSHPHLYLEFTPTQSTSRDLTPSNRETVANTPFANLNQASSIRACFEKMISEGEILQSPSPSQYSSAL